MHTVPYTTFRCTLRYIALHTCTSTYLLTIPAYIHKHAPMHTCTHMSLHYSTLCGTKLHSFPLHGFHILTLHCITSARLITARYTTVHHIITLRGSTCMTYIHTSSIDYNKLHPATLHSYIHQQPPKNMHATITYNTCMHVTYNTCMHACTALHSVAYMHDRTCLHARLRAVHHACA